MMNISVRIEQSGEGGCFFFGFYLFFFDGYLLYFTQDTAKLIHEPSRG